MGKKIVIQDTADVIVTSLKTGKVVMNAEAQLAGITGSISEEDLQGGIGNKKLFKIRTDKAVELAMRSALADVEYWAMTQGVEVDEAGTQVVTAVAKLEVNEDLEIVIPVALGLADADKVRVNLVDGTQVEGTVATGKVELSGAGATASKGKTVDVFYSKTVTGSRISIDSTKFSSAYKVEMRTIAYDVDTAEVTSDIYFVFPKAIPSGEFDISLENGSVYTPEVNFSVVNEIGNDELGSITLVPRA